MDAEQFMETEEPRRDFRRANGAPLVRDPENPAKLLRYSRPSGYGKALDDENALVEWRIWTAMNGVCRSKALQAKIMATEDADRESKKELKSEAMDKGSANERSDTGTALHAMTVRVERKDPSFVIPGEYAMDLRAYMDMLARYQLVSEMFELPIVNDRFRAAGTADRLFRLQRDLTAPDGTLVEAGSLVIGDLKTGKLDFALPGFSIQMALYATGVLYDINIERRMPTPPIRDDWALLVHMPVGKARASLLWCSLALGLEGCRMASEVKAWQNHWKKGQGHFDAPEVDVPPDLPEPVPAALVEAFGASEVVSPEIMNAFVAERVKGCRDVPAARTELLARWPEGCPSPKQGIVRSEDFIAVLDVLDDIEKQFSLPFIADPRRGSGHRSTTDRSNGRQLSN